MTFSNPIKPDLKEDMELIVDTGAILPWIPRKVLESISVKPISKKVFETMDGRFVERSTYFTKIRYEEHEAVVEVVVAEEGDVAVLDLIALENMGYRVDPITDQLKYVGLLTV